MGLGAPHGDVDVLNEREIHGTSGLGGDALAQLGRIEDLGRTLLDRQTGTTADQRVIRLSADCAWDLR